MRTIPILSDALWKERKSFDPDGKMHIGVAYVANRKNYLDIEDELNIRLRMPDGVLMTFRYKLDSVRWENEHGEAKEQQ
jgi:hypothetical protein